MNALSLRAARPKGLMAVLGAGKKNAGLWAPVTLRASETVILAEVNSRSEAYAVREKAEVSVELQLLHPFATVTPLEVQILVRPHNFSNSFTVHRTFNWLVGPGTNVRTALIPLNHPDLAWPWDFNKKHEFVAKVEVRHKDRLLDHRESLFSFDSVRYDPVYRVWTVNGKRVYPQPKHFRADGAFGPQAKAPPTPGR